MKPCGQCGSDDVRHVDETHSIHLYHHSDQFQQCQECGRMEAYRGVAADPETGLAFYLPDRDVGAPRPLCSIHERPMQPTKCWPDELRVQFKCTERTADGVCQAVETADLEPVATREDDGQ